MGNQKDNGRTIKFHAKKYVLHDGQTLIIRMPEKNDAQDLIDLVKLVDTETKFLVREPDEFNFSLDQEQMFIETNTKDDNRLFLIAQIDEKIIGTCSIGSIQKDKRLHHRAAIGIAIKKEYWRKGIGKIMMQACVDWCKSGGIEQIELDVVTKNKRAITLYKNLGFKIYGTRKNALKYADQTYADEYFMILFLNND